MRLFVLALAFVAIAIPANAQLTLTTTGMICAGNTVTADVSGGGAMLLTMLAMGETQGTTTIGGGPNAVTVGLESPFVMFPIGFTDANGDAGITFDIPVSIDPSILPGTLHVQAATVDFSFGMGSFGWTVETSNVTTVAGGTACP